MRVCAIASFRGMARMKRLLGSPTSIAEWGFTRYDDRPTVFTASLSGVSAKQEKIPDLLSRPWQRMK